MRDHNYQRFLDSMVIGFDQWHDGTGYDIELLGRLRTEDRLSIEKLLIGNLKGPGDWRDVEALVALGTPSAWNAVAESRKHRNAKVRNYAIGVLLEDPDPKLRGELEELVIQAVEQGHYGMAERMPTPRVKRALLESARKADPIIRTNAAALLLYLCGKTSEPYDWSMRPFFLRFARKDKKDLQAAWEELRQRAGY